jgi:lantibiotic modifying enzyme
MRLRSSIIGLFLLFFVVQLQAQSGLADSIQRIHLWLHQYVKTSAEGSSWPVIPGESSGRIGLDLYSGIPGIVLFYLEAHHATNKAEYLEEAKNGANFLLARLPEQLSEMDTQGKTGLFSGICGVGFTLQEVYKATKDKKYNEGFQRVLKLLLNAADTRGETTHWGYVTDIIAGNSGIGLFLLYAYRETKNFTYLELAANTCNWLINAAQRINTEQWKWRMWPGAERTMPNFSHGTAGVAYFAAEVFAILEEGRYLRVALNGARYLQTLKNAEGLIPHHEEGDGKQLFYYGYCHGPVGTARLYYVLYNSYKKERKTWEKPWEAAINTLLKSPIPQERTPGFWNNVSQCCGNAGVAEFFLTLYQMEGKKKYRNYAWLHTQDLLKRATSDAQGLRWIQAENRTEPEAVAAQTGYMQGAAGIGILLCHWLELEQGKKQLIRLPDEPYGKEAK